MATRREQASAPRRERPPHPKFTCGGVHALGPRCGLRVDAGSLPGIKLPSEVLGRALTQVSVSSLVGETGTQRQTEKEDKGETGR